MGRERRGVDKGENGAGLKAHGGDLAIDDAESGAATEGDEDEVAGAKREVGLVGEQGAVGAEDGGGNYLKKHETII